MDAEGSRSLTALLLPIRGCAPSRFDQHLLIRLPMSASVPLPTRPKLRSSPGVVLAAVVFLSACEVIQNEPATKQDTATAAAASGADSPAVAGDSLTGVPAVASDSALAAARAADTGSVRVHPARPRRGGVLFALGEGLGTPAPNCYWKNDQVPCFTTARGVMATIPLTAEETAGSFALM